MLKRDIILLAVFVLIVVLVGINGCADPTAKATGGEATGGEGGSAAIKGAEVDASVTVGAVATTIEALYTFPELLKDIFMDTFFRIVSCVAAALIWWDWREGNLHPAKPKHSKPKKSSKDSK